MTGWTDEWTPAVLAPEPGQVSGDAFGHWPDCLHFHVRPLRLSAGA
jgi:hypothetical protein